RTDKCVNSVLYLQTPSRNMSHHPNSVQQANPDIRANLLPQNASEPHIIPLEGMHLLLYEILFFFNDTPTTDIYTLSLHDALPIFRNIRALNGRFNTSITHAYSIVIGSKHITLNATGGGFLTASKQFRHGATSKSRSNTASNSTKHKSPHLSGWRQIISL